MKNKKTLIVSVLVLIFAVVGVFAYNTFLKEKEVDGTKNITITVINESESYKKEHSIKTDLGNLGAVLEEEKLAEFDKQGAGRFVIAVDNIKADDTKQQWWNVRINGSDAQVGVDDIVINDGDKFDLTLKTGW